jgi:hypothetical protein
MTDKIDSKIYELLNVLTEKKAEVERAEKESKKSWVTNCSLTLPGSNPVNIQTANETVLVEIVANLLKHRDYTNEAEDLLGLPHSNKIAGYAFSSWIEDCQKRLAVISLTTKKQALSALEKRLDGIVSPEQRRQMELEAIAKELAD